MSSTVILQVSKTVSSVSVKGYSSILPMSLSEEGYYSLHSVMSGRHHLQTNEIVICVDIDRIPQCHADFILRKSINAVNNCELLTPQRLAKTLQKITLQSPPIFSVLNGLQHNCPAKLSPEGSGIKPPITDPNLSFPHPHYPLSSWLSPILSAGLSPTSNLRPDGE